MPRSKNTTLDALLSKKDKLDKQIAAARARESVKARKLDTRRKVVAGAILLEHCEHDAEFKALVWSVFDQFLTKPHDRPLFDLAPLPPVEGAAPGPSSPSTTPTGGNHDRT